MTGSPASGFMALYRAHRGVVQRCVACLGLPHHQGPDLIQEVWLTAIRRIDELATHPQPAAWLCAVARNHAQHFVRGHLRRRAKHHAIASEPRREVDEPFREHDAWEALTRLLAECPVEQREVYLRVELFGMTASEVADELGVSVNTVHSRLRLSRQRLRAGASTLAALILILRDKLTMDGAIAAVRGPPTTAGVLAASAANPSVPTAMLTALVAAAVLALSGAARPGLDEVAGYIEHIDTEGQDESVHTSMRLQAWAESPSDAGIPSAASEPSPQRGDDAVPHRRARPPSPGSRTGAAPAVALRRPLPADDGEALLKAAMSHLQAGRFKLAHDAALRHRERFPASELRETRECLVGMILCSLGRDAEAREQVRAFARELPDEHMFRDRLRKLRPSCR